MSATTAEAEPPAAYAKSGPGAARRARERQQRSTARRVGWLAGLLQASQPHHTGTALCLGCLELEPKVATLERRLQKYEEVVSQAAAAVPESVRAALAGTLPGVPQVDSAQVANGEFAEKAFAKLSALQSPGDKSSDEEDDSKQDFCEEKSGNGVHGKQQDRKADHTTSIGAMECENGEVGEKVANNTDHEPKGTLSDIVLMEAVEANLFANLAQVTADAETEVAHHEAATTNNGECFEEPSRNGL